MQNAKTLKTFLRNAPASFIVKYRNPNALAQRVRAVLRGMPPAAWPGAGGMAARLHVAEATLRRKLPGGPRVPVDQGHATARSRVRGAGRPGRTIADVAAATGFAEPSAFYRAFRK